MHPATQTLSVPLAARVRPWPMAPREPRMCNTEDRRPGLSLTDRFLLRDGQPWIPVSGELHYSRVPRDRWAQRLRFMRSGGLTVVSSYVPWIHHVPQRGAPRFDGNRDVAAFVDLCRASGLEVMLRIGPWVHGEIRNGGFPDWVQQAPVGHRSDDPAYLDLVREWFGQIATALAGRCTPATVLAIQLENELDDQPGHLVTLKRLARDAGLSAALWTATGWGSAELPQEEVMPLYSGYGDGFWVDADAPWDAAFRQHFFFSHCWDDPGVGAEPGSSQQWAMEPEPPAFPPATCELGGGMATAYHRRPRPSALDIAAVANCKLGNGSAWQGYYMYAGGTNPSGDEDAQESHATGYPNDMPRLNYDFHAPIGEAGALAASHAQLRRQHAFLAAFGPQLAQMSSSLPDVLPADVDDTTTLRWAMRSDGCSGFLFLTWHQPHVALAAYRGAQFQVSLDKEQLLLPSRPIDIPAGTIARWPVALDVGGIRIDWATASVLTILPGETPTLVLCAEPGVPVELALPADGGDGRTVRMIEPGREPTRLHNGVRMLDVLVLAAADADAAWVEQGGRRLLLSHHDLSWDRDGRVNATTTGTTPDVRVYDPALRSFRSMRLRGDARAPVVAEVATALRRMGGTVPTTYGRHECRQSAPTAAVFDELATVYRLCLPPWTGRPEQDALLRIDWAGDVAQLRVDGRPHTDRFWDGSPWLISLRDADCSPASDVTLHILPLAADSSVHLPADAAGRVAASSGQLLAVDGVRVEARRIWRERAGIARIHHDPAVPTVRGVIDVDLPGPRISRHVYGHFAEHLGRGIYGGLFVGDRSDIPNDGGIRLDVVQALREIAIPNLRWPGGCFADEYHWRDGIGPREHRPRMVNSHWGDVVEDNSFGTHEFMALCALLDAEPYVTVNVGSGSVREASEWAEYLTRDDDSPMAALRRANGRDQPWRVRFWGLGNEPWGCGGGMRAEAYADLARVFGTYSRDCADNRLYRIAAGASSDDYRWTEVLMKGLGRAVGSGASGGGENREPFQAISLHHYTIPGSWAHKGSATQFGVEDYYATMAAAARTEEILARHAKIMDSYDPDQSIGLVLDEWGTWFDAEPGTHPGFLFQQNTLRDALVAAVHFDTFHRHAGRLIMANVAQTVNVLQAMLLTDGDQLVRTPSYHVLAMNKDHQDADSLAVRLLAPAPTRRVAYEDLATFSATASRRDGHVLISLTNLDAENPLDVELDLRGARPGLPTAVVLTAEAINTHNTIHDPHAVQPRPFDELEIVDGLLRVQLPRHSFVTVRIPVNA